jgi:hypothetical protein
MAITAIKNTFFIIAKFLIVFELRCKSTANSDKAQFFPCFFVNEHETKACFCDKSEEKPQNLSHTSKSDLAIRPIYHRLFNRIEAPKSEVTRGQVQFEKETFHAAAGGYHPPSSGGALY